MTPGPTESGPTVARYGPENNHSDGPATGRALNLVQNSTTVRRGLASKAGSALAVVLIVSFSFLTACADKKTVYLNADTGSGPRYAYVSGDSAILRTDPIVIASEVDFPPTGQRLTVLERTAKQDNIDGASDFWYRVRQDSGIEGWIFGASLSFSQQEMAQNFQGKKKEIEEVLPGIWWEIEGDGSTGYRKIVFKNGYFFYSYGNRLESSGQYEISDDLKLKLSAPTGMGQELEVRKVGLEYRIFSNVDNFSYVFRPAPEEKEYLEVEEEKEESSE